MAAKKRAVVTVNEGEKVPKRAVFGRPSSWRPEFAEMAFKFCLLGASNKQLAEFFGVAVSTIHMWRDAIPEFSDAVKRGKEIADAEIAHSLYQRAKGYSHPEDDIKALNGAIVITPTTKHYPPDTGAATLWLKNRQGHIWRDKTENVHTGPDGGPIEHSLRVTFVEPGRG